MTDRGRQKMRFYHVTTDKQISVILDAIESISIDQAPAVVETLQAGEVANLSNCRNNQVALNVYFRPLLDHHLAGGPVGFDHPQGCGAAIITDNYFYRGQRIPDDHAFLRNVLDLHFGGRRH